MKVKTAIAVLRQYGAFLHSAHESRPFLFKAGSMIERTISFFEEGREGKAHRWLGFIQGCLWCDGFYSVDEMRIHNQTGQVGEALAACDDAPTPETPVMVQLREIAVQARRHMRASADLQLLLVDLDIIERRIGNARELARKQRVGV